MYIVDASIFLEVELEQKKSGDCEQFLRKVEKGDIKAVITDFTIDSIVLIIEKYRNWRAIREFLESLPLLLGLTIYSPTQQDKIKTTDHMKTYNLDFDDALLVQSALSNSTKEIVSLDSDFDRVKLVKRIEPGELMHGLKEGEE